MTEHLTAGTLHRDLSAVSLVPRSLQHVDLAQDKGQSQEHGAPAHSVVVRGCKEAAMLCRWGEGLSFPPDSKICGVSLMCTHRNRTSKQATKYLLEDPSTHHSLHHDPGLGNTVSDI